MVTLNVKITKKHNNIELLSDVGNITIESSEISNHLTVSTHDFALWLFLPIAMRLNRDLHIQGSGSPAAKKNAQKLSLIWQTWLPGHFHNVSVSFDEEIERESSTISSGKDLIFFSGGVDSTYSILKRLERGENQDLLTVHGMDYKVEDTEKFTSFLDKTNEFSKFAGDKRIIVKTDAYQLYKQTRCNPKGAHITHIFALAGCAFLHDNYSHYFIASDFRLDQQFIAHPYGSNSATNGYFRSENHKLLSLDDDVTRCEKLPLILNNDLAMPSITFCKNYQFRPHNCGVCSKCMRTKVMFLARTGEIPDVFPDMSVPDNWFNEMQLSKKKLNRIYLSDILSCGEEFNTKDLIPTFQQALEKYDSFASAEIKETKPKQKISHQAKTLIKQLFGR